MARLRPAAAQRPSARAGRARTGPGRLGQPARAAARRRRHAAAPAPDPLVAGAPLRGPALRGQGQRRSAPATHAVGSQPCVLDRYPAARRPGAADLPVQGRGACLAAGRLAGGKGRHPVHPPRLGRQPADQPALGRTAAPRTQPADLPGRDHHQRRKPAHLPRSPDGQRPGSRRGGAAGGDQLPPRRRARCAGAVHRRRRPAQPPRPPAARRARQRAYPAAGTDPQPGPGPRRTGLPGPAGECAWRCSALPPLRKPGAPPSRAWAAPPARRTAGRRGPPRPRCRSARGGSRSGPGCRAPSTAAPGGVPRS